MTIAVAMSGGVDSSTAAALLAENNPPTTSDPHPPVIGLTMQLWNQRRLPQLLGVEAGAGGHASGRCCSLDDVYDARAVANFLAIPYYVVNLERQFEDAVVRPFVERYLAGTQPFASPGNSRSKVARSSMSSTTPSSSQGTSTTSFLCAQTTARAPTSSEAAYSSE